MTRALFAVPLAFVLSTVPAFAQGTTPSAPAGTTPTSGNPNLAVATLKLENGTRLSKVIGSSVYADANTSIGTVDDLVMTPDSKVSLAIISVGGFLGIGSKLVAVPFSALQAGPDGKLTLPGATKDSLNAMPNFTYG